MDILGLVDNHIDHGHIIPFLCTLNIAPEVLRRGDCPYVNGTNN